MLALALLAGACGSVANPEGAAVDPPTGIISPERIQAAFHAEVGRPLDSLTAPDVPPRPGSITLLDLRSGAEAEGFDDFDIRVYSESEAARSHIASDPDAVWDGSAGVYWQTYVEERGPDAGKVVFSATKLYGSNVLLTYFPPEKRLNDGWHRLDRLLSRLASHT
jgi:hypothetical protein